MALTGILAGYNEQRQVTGNYLAQLDAMQRAAIGQAMERQRMEQQRNQFEREIAARQNQSQQSTELDRARLAQQAQQFQANLGLRNQEFELKQKADSRQDQARNALRDLINAGGSDVDIAGLGRAVLPYDPTTGINLIRASKEEQRQQALLNRTGGTGVSAPQGYRWTQDGNLEAIPGGNADPRVLAQLESIKASSKGTNKQTAAQEQKTTDAQDVLGLLDMAAPFVEKGTGGYLGAGFNMIGQAVGYGGESAEANARLKAIEGMLISKMPKMSGPQSDKDVLLYRQMAGQIGDPTVPANVKQAAMDTIRQINERAAGVEQSSPARSSQTFNSLPDPRQYNGKTVRDTSTGTRWMSNGRDWVRAP